MNRYLLRLRGARQWFRIVRKHPRTATMPVWHGGVLAMPCPEWCGGHPNDGIEQHPGDFAHDGPLSGLTVVTARGGQEEILQVGFSWLPLSDLNVHLRMTVNLGEAGDTQVTAEELRTLATGLERHAVFCRGFADRYEVLYAETEESMRLAGLPSWLPRLSPLDQGQDGAL